MIAHHFVVNGPGGPTFHPDCVSQVEAIREAREACPMEGTWESWRLSNQDVDAWRSETADDPAALLQLCRHRLGRSSLTMTKSPT